MNTRTYLFVSIATCVVALVACGDKGEAPLGGCEDPRVVCDAEPDECQSDEDCPRDLRDLVCALEPGLDRLECQTPDDPPAKCEEPLRDALRVFPTPANRLVFFVASTCAPPPSVLLINQSDETVRIDAVQTGNFELDSDSPADGDGELFASADLPQDLAPSDSLPIDLQFFSETPGVTGTVDLEVLYSGGCERFAVRTIHSGPDAGGVAHPLGVDVGTASPGTLGEPVEVVFTPHGQDGSTTFNAGGVSNDVFQVVDPISPTTLLSCEPLSLSVRLVAPLETGVYEGDLFWGIETDTLSGVAFLSLIGRVE